MRKRQPVIVDVTLVSDTSSKLYLVKRAGVVLGFLEKHPNRQGEEHPWKAFDAICGQGPVRVAPGTMKPFFGRDARERAIAYLGGKA